MELKTLEECFIEAGSKFPFTVYWEVERKIVTITHRIDTKDHSISHLKYHWFANSKTGNSSVDSPLGFFGFAKEKKFKLTKASHAMVRQRRFETILNAKIKL